MRTVLLAFLLSICLWGAVPALGSTDNAPAATGFEERARAEKMSRSRYRDLEVFSLVLILVAGGAAILWAVRRK